LPMNEKAGTDIFRTGFRLLHDIKLYTEFVWRILHVYILLMHYIIFRRRRSFKTGIFDSGLVGTYRKGILVRILFELPFVLLRMTPLVFFMTVIVFYGYWGSKAKKNYEAVMNEDTDKE